MYLRFQCIVLMLVILVCVYLLLIVDATLSSSRRKGTNILVSLLRPKGGLNDQKGVPTENLKGRPGKGYYIAVEMGTPPQRVNINYLYFIVKLSTYSSFLLDLNHASQIWNFQNSSD